MKKKFHTIKIFFLLTCIFGSCESQTKNISGQPDVGKFADTVIRDIPHDSKGKQRGFYQKKVEMENMIGLSPLENGFDSLQIRIWYGVVLRDKLQLLILKKSDSKWSAQLYSLGLNYDKNRDSLVSVTKNIETKQPFLGWENVVDSLLMLGILDLPDSQNINGYDQGNDGYGATIEIATKIKYRIYNYSNFNEQNNIEQAKKIEQIMKLVEKGFSFSRLTIK